MSALSNVMGAGAFVPPMIHALHSFHRVCQRIGTFGRDFRDTRDTLRIEECRFGQVLNCDLQSLAKVGDTAKTVKAVNLQVANIQSHLDSCHECIDWYDSTASNEDPEQQALDPEVLQSSTRFHSRARWAFSDWQRLHDSLEHVRASIDGLYSLLRLDYSYASRPLQWNKQESDFSALLPVQKALNGLHHSLTSLNKTGKPDHQLSIQLREHWDNTSAEISSLSNVKIRDESYVFSIQKLQSNDPQTESVLLLVDTDKNVPGSQHGNSTYADLPRLESLDDPRGPAQSCAAAERGRVYALGYLPAQKSRSITNDFHIVHQVTASWRKPLCLTDMLSDPSFVERITPIAITWLAKLLVTSHLCFLPIQRALNIQPRPTNYRFYYNPEEAFDPWAEDNLLVLKPFLSIGFGTKRRATLGELSDFNHPPYASVMELGLVLYQIGAGRVINYGSGRAGLAEAKAKVLRELERESSVDILAGSSFVSIIEGCLNMWTRFRLYSDDLVAMRRREEEYLSEVVTQLSKDLQILEDRGPPERRDARLFTPKISPESITIPASTSRDRTIIETGTPNTRLDHLTTVDTTESMPEGTIAGGRAVTLDYPRITETMTEAEVLRQLRALTNESSDPPQANSHLIWSRLINNNSQPILPCPFHHLGCHLHHSDLAAWFQHSLTHLHISGPDTRMLSPLTANTCCVCERKFTADTGIDCWQQLLAHNAFHHLHGGTFADTAPDVQLYRYLWEHDLICQVTYDGLRGQSLELGNPVAKLPVRDLAGSAPMGQESVRANVIGERKFKMGRGLGWLRGR